MKRILCALTMIFTLAVLLSVNTVPVEAGESETKNLFEEYYNGGFYTKDTVINISQETADELNRLNLFHAGVNELVRTTYYDGGSLWMSRADGKYSYYGTKDSDMTNAVVDKVGDKSDSVVVKGKTMEEYYTTLKDLVDYDSAIWTQNGSVYTTQDEKILKYYLDFTAPCFLNFDSTAKTATNYFYLDKATLEEVNNTLVLKLHVSGTNSGMVNAGENGELVLSQATIRLSENLQASKGTDFDGFASTQTMKLASGWNNGHNNTGGATIEIIKEGSNVYGKLLPTANSGYSTVTHAGNKALLKAGTYTFSVDVKLGSAFDGKIVFGTWDGKAWVPGYRKVLDITNAKTDEWTTVTYTFTRSADSVGTYVNIDLGYQCVTAGENNYVLFDNFRFTKEGSSDVITGTNYNLEGFTFGEMASLAAGGWKSDNAGHTNVIYVGSSLGNELVQEGDNVVFKAYTSGVSTSIDFAGNVAFAKAGTYMMSIKVKLGPDATKVDNIGFRFYSNGSLGTGDYVFSGLEQLNSEEWVTLTAYFTIANTSSTTYINMNFWIFTHNDVIGSSNNYVLIDDIAVYAVVQ